jgi:hypothetical protein
MTILNNKALGQLFTVPEEDWIAINKRVGETAAAEGIASYIEQYIPEFPSLIQECNVWKGQTFDGMISQSAAISHYAGSAIIGFEGLLNAINALDPSQPTVPEPLQQKTLSLLSDLSKSTDLLSKIISDLNVQITTFLSVNQEVDAQILRYKEKLEVFWEPLGNIITHVDTATGLVTGVWLALSMDLQQYKDKSVDITMPFLLQLDIESALVNWKSLQAEADAFHQISANQKQYWLVGSEGLNPERL